MTETIHHYCSTSVFLSIVEKKEVWLTSLSQSNDQLEGIWMLRHWLGLFRAENDPKTRLMGRGAQLCVERFLQDNVALGTCFSEAPDLLSQWRGYAQDGSGFSVSFDRLKLEQDIRAQKSGYSLVLSKIAYGYQDLQKVNDIVRRLHDAFGDDASKYEESGDGYGSISLDMSPEKYAQQKHATSLLFTAKNGSFSEEKEWRLFLFESISDLAGVKFRESRGSVSPFIKLSVPPESIVGVTLGPTNQTPLPVVEAALKISGIRCEVYRSKASYRRI